MQKKIKISYFILNYIGKTRKIWDFLYFLLLIPNFLVLDERNKLLSNAREVHLTVYEFFQLNTHLFLIFVTGNKSPKLFLMHKYSI